MTSILHFITSELRPPVKKKEMKSLVCVVGKIEDYSVDEIKLIEEFAAAHLVWDDGITKDKRQALFLFFEKIEGERWMFHKEGWDVRRYQRVPSLGFVLMETYKMISRPVPPALVQVQKPREGAAAHA